MRKSPAPIDDLVLVAWHHMLTMPFLTVYTVDDGKINTRHINPHLAWQRSMQSLAINVNRMTQTMQEKLFPAFQDVSEVCQKFIDRLTDAGFILDDQAG